MNIEINNIKVKVKVIEQRSHKAIISVDFGDLIVRGFRVMDSKYDNMRGEKLWLTPPSYQDGGRRYHPIFFMPNKELWKRLEGKIWDEYARQQEEHYKKRFDLKDDDGIP